MILCFLLGHALCMAQNNSFVLSIQSSKSVHNEFTKQAENFENLDSLSVQSILEKRLAELQIIGFLEARVDSIDWKQDTVHAFIYSGNQYHWASLQPDSSLSIIGKPRIRKIYKQSFTPVSITELRQIKEDIIQELENDAYPFATVFLKDIAIADDSVSARLAVDLGPKVIIDSIVNRSPELINSAAISQHLGIRKGQPYSEKRIREASSNLNRIDFIGTSRPLEVGFFDDKAWVYISPTKAKSSRFDGIVGLVPDGSSTSALNLTGMLDLDLINLLKNGERLKMRWKAPGNGSQRMIVGVDYPYLLNLPIGIKTDLDLFRKDTSYFRLDAEAGFVVPMSQGNKINFFYLNRSSNKLNDQSPEGINNFKSNSYGVRWILNRLNHPNNASSGYFLEPSFSLGSRSEQNTEPSGTESLIEGRFIGSVFMPISQRIVGLVQNNSALRSQSQIPDNEKYRLGGHQNLRGFNEEALLFDGFCLWSLEVRYLFGEASNAHIFLDAAALWENVQSNLIFSYPIGIGFGLSLETRAGILSIDYAIGKPYQQSFDYRSAKIHFGIKTIF